MLKIKELEERKGSNIIVTNIKQSGRGRYYVNYNNDNKRGESNYQATTRRMVEYIQLYSYMVVMKKGKTRIIITFIIITLIIITLIIREICDCSGIRIKLQKSHKKLQPEIRTIFFKKIMLKGLRSR